MNETGKVIKAEKDIITVRFERKTECAKCKMCAFSESMTYFDLKLSNTVNAQAGDTVTVSMKSGAIIMSGIIVYIIPLIFTALGLVAGFFAGGEVLAVILGVVFLAAGFLFIALADKYLKSKNRIAAPCVTGIVKQKDRSTDKDAE